MAQTPGEPNGGGEVDRIRRVYARRDSARARPGAVVAAYRLVNEDRHARMRALVRQLGLWGETLLDVGCGVGWDLEQWATHGWPAVRLTGVDLVEERVVRARERVPEANVQVVGGDTLPFVDGSFAVTTAVTVFSSILDPGVRRRLFGEMTRVTRPGGLVLVYDFVVRNPRNHDVLAMTPGSRERARTPP